MVNETMNVHCTDILEPYLPQKTKRISSLSWTSRSSFSETPPENYDPVILLHPKDIRSAAKILKTKKIKGKNK